MSKTIDWKQECIKVISDLAYATGKIEGLGGNSDYLPERLTELLAKLDEPMEDASDE